MCIQLTVLISSLFFRYISETTEPTTRHEQYEHNDAIFSLQRECDENVVYSRAAKWTKLLAIVAFTAV